MCIKRLVVFATRCRDRQKADATQAVAFSLGSQLHVAMRASMVLRFSAAISVGKYNDNTQKSQISLSVYQWLECNGAQRIPFPAYKKNTSTRSTTSDFQWTQGNAMETESALTVYSYSAML